MEGRGPGALPWGGLGAGGPGDTPPATLGMEGEGEGDGGGKKKIKKIERQEERRSVSHPAPQSYQG